MKKQLLMPRPWRPPAHARRSIRSGLTRCSILAHAKKPREAPHPLSILMGGVFDEVLYDEQAAVADGDDGENSF